MAAGGEKMERALVLNLEELTAFLMVTTEQILFQAKAEAVNGDEI